MNPSNKKICIAINEPGLTTETFIKAHVQHLGGTILRTNILRPYDVNRLANTNEDAGPGLKGRLKKTYVHIDQAYKEKQIKTFFRRNGIRVVLAEYGIVGVKLFKLCRDCNVPLVVHFHGYDAYRHDLLAAFGNLYREMFLYASAIVVVSTDMEQQVIRLGAPPHKVFKNVYGVDVERFKHTPVRNTPKHLLAVGRFVEKKAPYLTLLAFKKVLETVPEAKLVMAGRGELFDVCLKIVSALRLEQNVVFKGSVNHQEVAELFRNTRVFVQHSVVSGSGDSEGTPNTILEAGACGVPVVSTKHAGIKDVIRHGYNGFLVDEGDVESMATYIISLLSDAGKAATIGNNARDEVLKNFTMQSSIANLGKILATAAGGTG